MEMLFGWILESSLLILMILGLRKFFMGRVPYACICALWLVVLFRFLIPVNLISTPFSVNNLISSYQSSVEKIKTSEMEQADVFLEADLSRGTMSESALDTTAQQVSTEKQALKAAPVIDWWMLFKRMWLIISSVLLVWFISSNVNMIRRLKQKREWYGKRGGVEIYTVSGIKNPCLYGLFHPVIYLPEALLATDSALSVDAEELEQIITHEYVHYLHKDYIWSVLRILLVSVYWFDPFLWLAVSCSKKDAELFCDETALRLLGEEKRFQYGELLLKLAEKHSWGDFRYSMLSMSKQGKEMEKRIRAISVCKHYSKLIFFPLLLLAALAVGTTCSTGIGSVSALTAFFTYANKQAVSEESGKQNKVVQMMEEAEISLPISSAIPVAQDSEESAMTGTMAIYSSTYQEAFANYINAFTEAVNTGNTDNLQQVLAVDSEVYEQQCAMAKNYYERGIREKVKSYSTSQVNTLTEEQIVINSQEKIKVFYADTTSKLVEQEYRYTCECIDGNWMITKMEEIPQKEVQTS